MRYLLFLSFVFFLLNCENKPNKKETSPVTRSVKKEVKTIKKDSVKKTEREFPKLGSNISAMEFFLEYDKKHKENKVRIYTDFGNIDVLLFNETKFHRSNFIWLTKQQYFVGTQFYRIVPNFIIQGGDGDDTETAKKRNYIGKYLLPPDTKKGFKHHRGTISMPSSEIENAYKLASPYEFFIVQQKGGAHHLDGAYTVFGKVTKGMSVVDEIANQKTDGSEWPAKNIYIKKVEILN